MEGKKKKLTAQEDKQFLRKAVALNIAKGDSEEVAANKFAKLATSPELAACCVIESSERKSGIGDHFDVPVMLEQLREQAVTVGHGDLSQAEAMLMNQATALQSLFSRLTEKAMTAEYITNFEAFMRMALRAQSQCRGTLETLSAIKNPLIVYARQANVTTGPQQINNGAMKPSQAREIESNQNQLSGAPHELLSNTRASGNAGQANSALETLGEIDWAKIPRG